MKIISVCERCARRVSGNFVRLTANASLCPRCGALRHLLVLEVAS